MISVSGIKTLQHLQAAMKYLEAHDEGEPLKLEIDPVLGSLTISIVPTIWLSGDISPESEQLINDGYMKPAGEKIDFAPDSACASCGLDNRNGTHDAMQVIGHLSHKFEPLK